MSEEAFALKDAYAEDGEQPFAGATMAYGPDGHTADLGAMLEEGGGVIRTSDPTLIRALREHEFFKQATRADAADAPLLVTQPDGTPPAPPAPEEDEPDPPAPAPSADQPAAEPVSHDAHSLADLRAMYAAELSVGADDVPDELTRRQLADAINQSRESRGAVSGGDA